MDLAIATHFAFELSEDSDVLLQFEVASTAGQQVSDSTTSLGPTKNINRVAAHDNIGERFWLRQKGLVEVDYSARITVDRIQPDIAGLAGVPPQEMPAHAVQYLFASRYCPVDRFQPFVDTEFAGTTGGIRIEAIHKWIVQNFTYQIGISDNRTDALDSFVERRGICRDYAHVLVTMARASGIPARYVAGYAPQVDPPDFHAIAEVFLQNPDEPGSGAWHLLDATGMTNAASFAKIGVGRDAADVSFLTALGPCNFLRSSVAVGISSNE
ncbi:MAG: transglutaminase family protein [Erythrobacter sp.]